MFAKTAQWKTFVYKTLPRLALGFCLVLLPSLNSTGEIAQPIENLSCKSKDPTPISRIYIKSWGQCRCHQGVTWEAEAGRSSEAHCHLATKHFACLVTSQ